MKSFKNKVAAITGAGSGIGRALAQQLASVGCHLALSDVDARGLAETTELVSAKGVTVTSTRVDVADRAAVQAWADASAEAHGRINLVFNNAGVAQAGTVEGTSLEDYEWIININLWGVIYGTKAFLPHLKASGDGHIVNVSSIFGLFAQPGMSAYNVTKFAVRGFTESLRQELDMAGNGVSATCVHPGGIKTNIAKTARTSSSLAQVTGKSADESTQAFEKLFRTSPEKAADTILAGVRRNARRVLIGGDAYAVDLMQRLLPTAYQLLVVKALGGMAKRK